MCAIDDEFTDGIGFPSDIIMDCPCFARGFLDRCDMIEFESRVRFAHDRCFDAFEAHLRRVVSIAISPTVAVICLQNSLSVELILVTLAACLSNLLTRRAAVL